MPSTSDSNVALGFNFDNSYFRELQGMYAPWQGDNVPKPSMLKLNTELADSLGLDSTALATNYGAQVLCGAASPKGADPLAMAYAGHQFGGYSPQLGDGRALLVGEILDTQGNRVDLHLKGSGRTPFSRGGDGKAAIKPVLREYLIGEAMHALHIPTTRALAAVATGENVMRESPLPGAVLARVASSHLRVGSFQYAAATGDDDTIRRLADYAIARHYPDLQKSESPYLGLLCAVRDAQAELVAKWVSVGFVHGVMNTDNVTISGETIDYGPCAFIDTYLPRALFSSIDRNGRYAYANQPNIAQWNLARFAETLIPLIDADDSDRAIELATEAINAYPDIYSEHWLTAMSAKLGLVEHFEEDMALATDLLRSMEGRTDFTQLFRSLSSVSRGNPETAKALVTGDKTFVLWLQRYQQRLEKESVTGESRAAAMDAVNPIYIPRNHLVEEALEAGQAGDMEPFEHLLEVLSSPFTERKGVDRYAEPAPESFGSYVTYCGT